MKKKIAYSLTYLLLLIGISCSNDESLTTKDNQKNSKTAKGSQITSSVNSSYPIYRFFKNGTGHLYTINFDEGQNNGYTYEGILTEVYPAVDNSVMTALTITRWFNKNNGDRLITITPNEIANDIFTYTNTDTNSPYIPGTKILKSSTKSNGGWVYEGIIGRSGDFYNYSNNTISFNFGAKGIYRYYNSNTHDHLFTNSFYELSGAEGASGYSYDGVAFHEEN
ncbi:hypothetical protein OX284_010695 [Flavobacterium sp. SUN046]|uniref:hypothetical protein n=1 Tax=Flavobacterium sp. SUN046 TaxID=3002440 RepID=UPI002DBF9048|nr:hypothetical protein [Flavobacterium sp. SUN046]MEC4049897.1 hypothetical protein [Flavobacterium sp. SUN046]